jgi:NAD(P)-dependent dehydrogenase (short-subunit alcohol dehydrogenase family)
VANWFSMAGRRAMITGASMSIGRSIALGFADQGAAVALHYSATADARAGLPEAARATAEEIRSRGVDACLIDVDLAEPDSGKRALASAIDQLGAVDVLVICASVQTRTPFEAVAATEIERQFRINFAATVELLQVALPPMKERGWGRALLISSINQVRPAPDLAIYAALKSAQHNLAINLARSYAPFNVMINTLAPGLVATERNRWRRQNLDDWREIERRSAAPIGRAASPDEMVGAALLFCSEAASYIAGAELMVTGGSHLASAG